jgi:hypothetical protein
MRRAPVTITAKPPVYQEKTQDPRRPEVSHRCGKHEQYRKANGFAMIRAGEEKVGGIAR